MEELIKSRARLHKVGENYTSDGYVVTPNTERLLKEHVVRTGGQVRSCFPQENRAEDGSAPKIVI